MTTVTIDTHTAAELQILGNAERASDFAFDADDAVHVVGERATEVVAAEARASVAAREERAAVVVRLAGKGQLEEVEDLLEDRLAVVAVDPVGLEVGYLVGDPEPEQAEQPRHQSFDQDRTLS